MKTVQEYNDLDGNYCPFCDSDNIRAYPVEEDGDIIYRDHECWTCGRGWVEYLTVVEIVPTDG
jgi:hypothetical protein